MKHRFVTVLLERKRAELGEDPVTFWRRFFNWRSADNIERHASKIRSFKKDFPERKLGVAAEVLDIPYELLRTI